MRMADRDSYTWELRCKTCGRTGSANVSEDAVPDADDLRFEVDTLSDGFELSKLGKTACDTEIVCAECGAAV